MQEEHNTEEHNTDTAPLVLAYLGDAYFELMVRKYAFDTGSHKNEKLHRHVTALVNAAAQSRMVGYLDGKLFEEEADIVRRGRNAKTLTAPKNVPITDYKRATGLEALFGYLYLNGRTKRAEELLRICMDGEAAWQKEQEK